MAPATIDGGGATQPRVGEGNGMGLFGRRNRKSLGTLGGNPSEVDEVLDDGVPVVPGPHGLHPDFELYAEREGAAADADLAADVSSDFENYDDIEGRGT